MRNNKKSQLTLTIGSILYAAWFIFAYLDIFYWHLDPQSAVGLLLVGIYSLPIMGVIWMIAALFNKKDA